jgi:hypothetical protein
MSCSSRGIALLDRGLIYATEDYGYVDFTVPRFDEFMRRHIPFKPAPSRSTKSRARRSS